MKKLVFALMFMLLLCSCGVSEPVIDEPAPESEISASEDENEKELIPVGGESAKSENYIINEIYSVAENDLTKYASGAFRIEEMGISHKASNVIVNDNGTLTFDLTLKKGDKVITENMQGYWLSDIPNYDPTTVRTSVEWGGYSFTANGHLVICGINDVVIINPVDFSVIDIEFDFDGLTDDYIDLWISGVIYDENNENWIISAGEAYPRFSYGEKMPWNIFVFDSEGKFVEKYESGVSAIYGGWLDFATTYVAGSCTVLRKGGKTYYSFGARCYCPETGKTFQGSSYSEPYNAESGSYSVYFYDCYLMDENSDGNYSSTGKPLGFYAVLKQHGNIIDFFSTNDEYIAASDGWGEVENVLKLTHEGGRSFTVENSYLAKSMKLDFEKEKYSVSYNYTDEHLIEHIADSADGNYSLWQAGTDGGGEAYFYDVALKNNKTGKIFHLKPNGTNVGRFSYEGFLKNGDVYVFSSSGLRIYNPETAEMIFDIDKNFPMENRILYTFRRDPKDFSYIIVYSDYTENGKYDEESWPHLAPYTIKIGCLDKNGKLLESFDSGITARYGYFGLEAIEMRYSEEELLLVTSGGKGFNGIQFTFDRKTETFSEPVPVE